jgi:hypothetical protein
VSDAAAAARGAQLELRSRGVAGIAVPTFVKGYLPIDSTVELRLTLAVK